MEITGAHIRAVDKDMQIVGKLSHGRMTAAGGSIKTVTRRVITADGITGVHIVGVGIRMVFITVRKEQTRDQEQVDQILHQLKGNRHLGSKCHVKCVTSQV